MATPLSFRFRTEERALNNFRSIMNAPREKRKNEKKGLQIRCIPLAFCDTDNFHYKEPKLLRILQTDEHHEIETYSNQDQQLEANSTELPKSSESHSPG